MSDRIARTPITERPDLAADLASRIPDLHAGGVRVFMMSGARIALSFSRCRSPADSVGVRRSADAARMSPNFLR